MQVEEKLMRSIIKDPFAKEINDIEFDFKMDGIWHYSLNQCSERVAAALQEASKEQKTPRTFAVSDVKASKTCWFCFLSELEGTVRGHGLSTIVQAEVLTAKLMTSSSSQPMNWIDSHHNELERLMGRVKDFFNYSEVSSLFARMEALESEIPVLGAKMQELYKHPSYLEALHAWMLERSKGAELNMGMCLIGFRKSRPYSPSWNEGMYQAYSVLSDEKKIVLYAPRYMVTMLEYFHRPNPAAPFPTVDWELAPEDPIILETATRLWSPDGDGPLSRISGAINTAKAL